MMGKTKNGGRKNFTTPSQGREEEETERERERIIWNLGREDGGWELGNNSWQRYEFQVLQRFNATQSVLQLALTLVRILLRREKS
jgi:hypothetical protein